VCPNLVRWARLSSKKSIRLKKRRSDAFETVPTLEERLKSRDASP